MGAAVSLALVVAAGLAVLIWSRKDPWGPPEASVAAQADALVARWNAQHLAPDKRALTVLVYDRSSAGAPVDPPEEADALARRSPLDRLLGEPPPDPETAAFLDSMRREPSVVLVRYDPRGKGVSSAAEAVKEAIVKGHDAGAEINVVTHGASIAPAVKALAQLDGVTRQGVAVGVNKLVALGIERQKLKLIDSFFGGDPRPKNVLEWANVYREAGTVPPKTYLDLSARGQPPVQFKGGLAAAVSAEPAKSVMELLSDVRPIAAAAKAAKPPEEPAGERPFRALDGQVSMKAFRTEAAAMPSRPQPGPDSLGMIKGEDDSGKVAAIKAKPGDCGEGFHTLLPDPDWCCPDKASERFTAAKGTPERACANRTGCTPAGSSSAAKRCAHSFFVDANDQWWCCPAKERIDRFTRCYEDAVREARSAAGCRLAPGLLHPREP